MKQLFVIMHIIEESEEDLKLSCQLEHGSIWETYMDKERAEKEVERLNKHSFESYTLNEKGYFHKWIIAETYLM